MSGDILLDCTIPGKPIGKGRPRVERHRNGAVVTRNPDSTTAWEAMAMLFLRSAWGRSALGRDEAVTVEIVAVMPRTKDQLPGKRRTVIEGRLVHTGKPDVDNIAKIALDALVLAGVLEDDTSVTRLVVERWRCALGEPPGVRVTVRTWMPDAAPGMPL